MTASKFPRLLLALAALLALSALLMAACEDDEDGGQTPAAGETPADGGDEIDISAVPELQDGVLTVGSDIAYAPFEFYIEGTEDADGLDIDIARAVAGVLGVEVEFLNTGFDGLIPSLDTDDFDVIVSAMTITDERSQEIDLVPYISVGTGIVVPAGNPNGISALDDLCGLTVAVQLGTIQVDLLNEQNDACDDPIDVVTFDTNPLAVEDLRTGGADANFSDFPVAAEDAAQSGGELEVVDTQIAPEPYGIGVRKESPELRDVIADAIAAIRESGMYDQILADWGLEAVALD